MIYLSKGGGPVLIRTIRGSAPVSCVHILTLYEKQFFHKFNKVGLNILHVKKWSILEFYLGKLSHQSVLKVLATIPHFKFYFFPHLVIFLQFRDPSYVLNLSTKAVLQKWQIWCKRAKYLQLELIFRRA